MIALQRDDSDILMLNLLDFSCSICGNNHQEHDHNLLRAKRKHFLFRYEGFNVCGVHKDNDSHAMAIVLADKSILFWSPFYVCEAWACTVCDLKCGPGLLKAMEHIKEEAHINNRSFEHVADVALMKMPVFFKHESVAAFIKAHNLDLKIKRV